MFIFSLFVDFCDIYAHFIFSFINFRIEVSARENAIKIEARGIFVGAKVTRGLDWRWNDQDGELQK